MNISLVNGLKVKILPAIRSSITNKPENAMFASLPTQMAAAINSQLASQLELWVSLNNKMLESVEKFVNLNMNAVKQSLVNSAASQQLLSAENAPGPRWVSASHVGAHDNVLSYGYQPADVAWCWYAEIAKSARARVDRTNRKMSELFEDTAKNTLAGAGRMGSIVMPIPGQSSSESPETISREKNPMPNPNRQYRQPN